jgi:hypothetical protein
MRWPAQRVGTQRQRRSVELLLSGPLRLHRQNPKKGEHDVSLNGVRHVWPCKYQSGQLSSVHAPAPLKGECHEPSRRI